MEYCFNHPDVKSSATCPYCGKGYCAACLRLLGQRKIIICTSCYTILYEKVQRSIPRKRLLVAAALVIGVLCIAYGIFALTAIDPAAGLISLIVGVVNLGTAALNMIRLRQAQEWKMIEPFHAPGQG